MTRLLIEGGENARVIGVAGAPLKQVLCFFASVFPEITMEQVDHRPEMTSFFYVHLKEVAHVVQRGSSFPQQALLFDRCRFGVALRHNNPAKRRTILARNVLPGGLTLMIPEMDLAIVIVGNQKYAPAILGHAYVAEVSPTVFFHADGGAQIDLKIRSAGRASVVPPAKECRLPALQRALQRAVAGEVDVVGDQLCVIDVHCDISDMDPPGSTLHPLPVELCFVPTSVHLQRSGLSNCVRTDKNPVLPCREATEDSREHRFGLSEAKIGFETGECVG